MKTFKELMQEAGVLWPGTPEYKKAFPDTDRSAKAKPGTMTKGNRHDIKTTATGVIATRRFDKDDEAAEPTKPAEPAVKRGRGRPPGKYGTYTKRKVAEAFEILEQLENEEDIDTFLETLDEETLVAMSESVEEVELDEAAKWRRDDLEGKTWRSRDWDDGEMSPDKIILGRDGKDVDNYDQDELSHRPGNYRSKADMNKRMTKKGVPTKSEISAQQHLKHMLKSKSKAGFGGVITGPKGKLPEEVELDVTEAAKWRRDDLEGKTWRSSAHDDDEEAPRKVILGRDGKESGNYNRDELAHRAGASQRFLKATLKSKAKITGPKSKLPEEVELEESIVGKPVVTGRHKGASAYGDTHTRIVTHHEVDGHKYTATTDHDHDGASFRDIRDASGTVVHSISKMPHSHYSDNKPLVHTNKIDPGHLKKISKDHDVHAEKHNPDNA